MTKDGVHKRNGSLKEFRILRILVIHRIARSAKNEEVRLSTNRERRNMHHKASK